MRRLFKLALLASTAGGALVLAGPALATPRLIVSGTTIQVTEDKSDAAPLHTSIFIPSGYTASPAQTPGAQIGTVHADLQALAISPDAIIQADGTVLAADSTSPTLQAAATQCTGTATHAGIWLLHVTVSGQTIDVPVYVDATAGAETALGVAKLQLCLPDPYDNAPASQRAVFGVKIINAKLTLNTSVLTAPASGSFLWRSVITPWNTTAFAPDLAHTIEVQSPVLVPQTLSLSAKVKTIRHKHGKKTTVTNSVLLSGKLLENLQGVSGATVDIYAGGKKRGSTKTNSSGAYSRSLGLPNKTSFQAKATVPQRDVACQSPLPPTSAPGGCIGATIAGYTLSSPTVTATPKKK